MNRPDASMSLLTDIQEQALEPGYGAAVNRGTSRPRLIVAVVLLATLLTVAVLQTTQGAGAAENQRAELLERVSTAREREASLNDQAASLDSEVRSLGEAAIGDPADREALAAAEVAAGSLPVTGPGIVVTVDDAADATGSQGLVLDSDLSRLVNGLWAAGAEAISINGRRLTTMTPIRAAGAAITVDFVSLSPPYRVEVIGNPDTLPARFNQTPAAAWWQFLSMNYGLRMDVQPSGEDLMLPADPGQSVRFARQK